jgi:hypothetical protein
MEVKRVCYSISISQQYLVFNLFCASVIGANTKILASSRVISFVIFFYKKIESFNDENLVCFYCITTSTKSKEALPPINTRCWTNNRCPTSSRCLMWAFSNKDTRCSVQCKHFPTSIIKITATCQNWRAQNWYLNWSNCGG